MDVIVHGADSETYHGRPMTLQFYSGDMEYEQCLWVDEHTSTQGFFEWADSLPRHCLHVVYVHNLEFDLPEFFWSYKEQLITTGGDFHFDVDGWHVSGVYGKPTFCRLTHRHQSRQILIVDSYYWFAGSLKNAAKLYCPHLPKLKTPKGLGTKKFGMNDDNFYAYAMRDAEIDYHIGVSVQKIIREFDIRQPVSLADMAAKIFRHHFLKHTIPQPSRAVSMAALRSYHGGKNNVVSGNAPAWHIDITSMDISSAYPYAMSQLPSMSFKAYKRYQMTRKRVTSVPELGVYCVSGTADKSEWSVIFHHGFQPIDGKFSRVWIQGFELNEALRTKKIKVNSLRGHYYDQDKDNRESPFDAFCQHFYHLKETQTDPVLRYMYKIILNAVYGKFIQTRKNSRIIYTDVDANETEETHDLIAGGMFHPFIASAITAHTRAYMHQIETAHEAFHSATDGIFTKRKRVIQVPFSPAKGLGALQIEARGDLVLLRNKCYILYADKPLDKKSIRSQYFRGKYIIKSAKHGFQGSVYDLEKLVAHNKRKYKASRPNRLREALKRNLDVNDFVEREYQLKIGPIGVKK